MGKLLSIESGELEAKVDLDRTLLDTDLFLHTLLVLLAEQKKGIVPAQEFTRTETDFMDKSDGLRRYLFWKHMADLGFSEQQIWDLKRPLAARPLLYSDALRGLNYLNERCKKTQILTFGEKDYQGFKLACVPLLGQFATDAEIIDCRKNEAMNDVPPPNVLFDDNDISGELSLGSVMVCVNRHSHVPLVQHSERHFTIANLEPETLEQIL